VDFTFPQGLISRSTMEKLRLSRCKRVEMQISADLLAALKSGKRLSITCQNAARNSFVLSLALNNFADAFQKIQ
jgi:invasion protein IalB